MSSSSIRILLNGATGNTGAATIRALQNRSPSTYIRAGTRDPSKPEAQKFRKGFHNLGLCELDGNDPESIRRACEGMTKVLVIMPGSAPTLRDRLKPVLTMFDVIKDIPSIEHVVYYSAVMAEAPNWSFGQLMLEGEHALRKIGKNYTIIRLGQFQENYLLSAQQIREQRILVQPTKDAKYAPIAAADLGEATAAVLLSPGSEYYSQTFEVYGPELLSGRELASELSDGLGFAVKHESPAPADYEKALLGFGMPAWQARGFRELWDAVVDGYGTKDFAGNAWSRLVRDRKQITFREWVDQHRDAFFGEKMETDKPKEAAKDSSSSHHHREHLPHPHIQKDMLPPGATPAGVDLNKDEQRAVHEAVAKALGSH